MTTLKNTFANFKNLDIQIKAGIIAAVLFSISFITMISLHGFREF